MPFKSEKQRRYLWATHPDIAKEWAHKYPESNKGLPMYAKKDKKHTPKEKAAQLDVLGLISPYVNKSIHKTTSILADISRQNVKSAADKLVKVDIPHSDKPTYAGQERAEGENHSADIKSEKPQARKPENAINSLLQKLSVVLSQPMAQALEDRKAQEEGREPAYQPKNPGISRYSAPVAAVPPPMGMQQAQPAQAQQPQQAQQQGAGMNSPSANPIQSFGPLSASGNINGNAAFGQKNSPDSLKTAAGNSVLSQLMSMDYSHLPDADDLDYDDEYMKAATSGVTTGPGAALSGASNIFSRAHKSVSDFLRGDEKGLDSRWGLIGAPLATAPLAAANMAYTNTVLPFVGKRGNPAALDALKDFAVSNNINVRDVADQAQALRDAGEGLPSFMKRFTENAAKTVEKAPGFYTPAGGEHNVFINKKWPSPGILAHEVGHALGGKKMLLANAVGKQLSGLSMAPVLMSRDENTSRNFAIGGTVSAAPLLASEIDASRRGAGIMKNLKLKGRLGAYVGVPTYAAFAGMPLMAHYGKKYFGGFDNRTKTSAYKDAANMSPESFGSHIAKYIKQADERPGFAEDTLGQMGGIAGGAAGLIGGAHFAGPEKIIEGLNGGVFPKGHLGAYGNPDNWDVPGMGKRFADDVSHWANMQGLSYGARTVGNKVAPNLVSKPGIGSTLRNLAAKAIVPLSKTTPGRVALGLGAIAPTAIAAGLGMGAGRAAGGAIGKQIDGPKQPTAPAPVAK